MPEVKIILTDSYYNGDETLISTTDWEQISDEDLLHLQNHKHRIRWSPYGFEPTIVIKDTKPIADRIEAIKNLIAEDQLQAAEKALKAKQRQLKKLSNMIKDNPEILDEISAIK